MRDQPRDHYFPDDHRIIPIADFAAHVPADRIDPCVFRIKAAAQQQVGVADGHLRVFRAADNQQGRAVSFDHVLLHERHGRENRRELVELGACQRVLRREELLLDENTVKQVWLLRRMVSMISADSNKFSEATERALKAEYEAKKKSDHWF